MIIFVYRMEFDETKWSGTPKSDQYGTMLMGGFTTDFIGNSIR